jgi:CBS domain-containing protein
MATLGELMNTTVVTAAAGDSVAVAAAAMVAAGVGSAVVLQGTFLAGILTVASAEDLRQARVSDWMTADPTALGPDASAEEAAQVMLLSGFRHLPVVEGRDVRGVVSLRDLFAARIRR